MIVDCGSNGCYIVSGPYDIFTEGPYIHKYIGREGDLEFRTSKKGWTGPETLRVNVWDHEDRVVSDVLLEGVRPESVHFYPDFPETYISYQTANGQTRFLSKEAVLQKVQAALQK